MNYLAHLYLSGDDADVLVGNFIGDHVKGRRFTRYHGGVQTGILLHRHIDTFTDKHPIFRESASLFKDGYKRYAGVVADIVYDHFLAANWHNYSDMDLHTFVGRSHHVLMRNYFGLPGRVKQFLPFLVKSRRLETYQYYEGVARTLNIMSSHRSLPDETTFAMHQLETCYDVLQKQFEAFMPEIITASRAFLASPEGLYRFDHAVVSR